MYLLIYIKYLNYYFTHASILNIHYYKLLINKKNHDTFNTNT